MFNDTVGAKDLVVAFNKTGVSVLMRFFTFIMCLLPLSVLSMAACGAMDDRNHTAYVHLPARDIQQVPVWPAVEGTEPASRLNRLIRSDQLDALIAEALKANPGLQQTLLTLKIRQSEERQIRAGLLPTLDADFSGSKAEHADNSYTSSLTVSWEADLWRKIADDYRAAGKDTAEQQALYRSARDTLAAEVIKAWLELIAGRNAIRIERHRLDTLTKNRDFILKRYRNGLGRLEDLDSARSAVASSKATLAQYRETLNSGRRALRQMLGRPDHAMIHIPEDYPDVVIPLADLPEQTLRRRPDLQAAYLAIEAASLRTAVAYKDLLPTISIEAALEDTAGSARSALFTDPVWILLGQLTAPLFQGGRLKAAAEIAELETARYYQAYRETLLTAVNEVENALGQEQALAGQQVHIETALASERNNLVQYQRSYRSGLADILDLLTVQQETYDLEAQLDDIIHQRLANRVTLGLALGLGVDK